MLSDVNVPQGQMEIILDRLINIVLTTGHSLAVGGTATKVKLAGGTTAVFRCPSAATAVAAENSWTVADDFDVTAATCYDAGGGQVTKGQIAINAVNNPSTGSGARVAYVVAISSAGAVSLVSSGVVAGLTGAIKLPQIPHSISGTVCVLGYVTVKVTAGNVFTPGTTAFTGTGCTATYNFVPVLTGGESITVA